MKTISIPVYNRPDHLRRVLDSIRACKTWREWTMVFSCEPHPPSETRQLIASLSLNSIRYSENTVRLGCWENTFHAASLAMALKPEVNLYLEDDYLIIPDTLTMVDQWAASNCEGVLALRRPDNTQDASQPSVVAEYRTGLYGCGFAWRAADWPIIRRQWFAPGPMWDIAMEGLPLRQWRPLVNRSYGIGIVGTHTHGNNADKNLFGPAYDGPPVSQFHFRA